MLRGGNIEFFDEFGSLFMNYEFRLIFYIMNPQNFIIVYSTMSK